MPFCPATSSVSHKAPNAYIYATLGGSVAMDTKSRFWSRVQKTEGCWLWTGCVNSTGYGSGTFGKARTHMAHRFSWEIAHGPIPDGLCVCHRCDNPRCVRPDHLFLGTRSDNQNDRVAKGRHNEATKTHCRNGHEFTPENTYHNPAKKPHHRSCYQCIRERSVEYTERRRQRNRAKRMAS